MLDGGWMDGWMIDDGWMDGSLTVDKNMFNISQMNWITLPTTRKQAQPIIPLIVRTFLFFVKPTQKRMKKKIILTCLCVLPEYNTTLLIWICTCAYIITPVVLQIRTPKRAKWNIAARNKVTQPLFKKQSFHTTWCRASETRSGRQHAPQFTQTYDDWCFSGAISATSAESNTSGCDWRRFQPCYWETGYACQGTNRSPDCLMATYLHPHPLCSQPLLGFFTGTSPGSLQLSSTAATSVDNVCVVTRKQPKQPDRAVGETPR